MGRRAAALAGTPRVYAATVSREHYLGLAAAMGDDVPEGVEAPDPETFDLGVADALITARVDVSSVLDRKRAAMAVHASQIPAESFFLALAPDAFRIAFGLRVVHPPRRDPGRARDLALLGAPTAPPDPQTGPLEPQ